MLNQQWIQHKANWFNDLIKRKQDHSIKTEIWNEFELVLEGTTIKGEYLHVWRSKETGLLDWSVEK